MQKYLVGGTLLVGVVSAGLVLSKDEEQNEFDPKVHTLESLKKLMDEMYLEYSCAYVYYFNLLSNYGKGSRVTDD